VLPIIGTLLQQFYHVRARVGLLVSRVAVLIEVAKESCSVLMR